MGDVAPYLGPEEADAAVRRAIARYIRRRREMAPDFVRRNFRLRGTLELHRRAVGRDLLRAPANIALAGPNLALEAAARLAERGGYEGAAAGMRRGRKVFVTDVAREIEWRLFTELLELPYGQPGRNSERDALAEEIARDPAVSVLLDRLSTASASPGFRAWAERAAGRYGEARLAVAELAAALVSAGIGAAAFRQWTPGALSLGPVAAQALAQQAAIAGFPLGAAAGGLWYSVFPAKASTVAVAGLTGALVLLPAMLTAFAGVAADPVQARLGIHDRRLTRLLDALEGRLLGDAGPGFNPREPWVARILDLVDLLNLVRRTAG